MILLLATGVAVLLLAVAAGFRLARTWPRFYSLLALGLASTAVVASALVIRAPTGDGWSDRSEVLGQWVPSAPLAAAILVAPIVWIFGLGIGTFAWVVLRPTASR